MKKLIVIGFIFFTALILCKKVNAQRINFSTWVGNNSITITPGSPSNLNFGYFLSGISSNQKSIKLTDNSAAVFEINAPVGYDISVWISAPKVLVNENNSNSTIPFTLSFAYSNYGDNNVTTAKQNAVQVPPNYNMATFPVFRSASGPPSGPPPPPSGQNNRTYKTAYLFIYGNVGPVSAQAMPGNYSATININVNFANE